MLKELSTEQKELQEVVKKEYTDLLFSNKTTLNKESCIEGISWMYGLCKKPKPIIIFVDSPMACQFAVYYLKNVFSSGEIAQVRDQVGDQVGDQVWDQVRDQVRIFQSFCSYGSIRDYGWVAFFDYFSRINVPVPESFIKFMAFIKSGHYDMVQLNGFCIVSSMPVDVNRNDNLQLHSTSGAAIEWSDGYKLHFINGRAMPAKIFEGFTKSDFISETNEDVRAGMFEIIEAKGEGSMLDFLGAKLVSNETVVHSNGEMEELTLYKSEELFEEETDLNGKSNVPLAWLRLVCPSTGSNYLINTDSSFVSATEAAKYHRPEIVPASLDYSWASRS